MIIAFYSTGSTFDFLHAPFKNDKSLLVRGLTVTKDRESVDSCTFNAPYGCVIDTATAPMKLFVAVAEYVGSDPSCLSSHTAAEILGACTNQSAPEDLNGKMRLLIWGRAISSNGKMDENGEFSADFTVEGAEGFLSSTPWRMDMSMLNSQMDTLVKGGATYYSDGSIKTTLYDAVRAIVARHNTFATAQTATLVMDEGIKSNDVYISNGSGTTCRDALREVVGQAGCEFYVIPRNVVSPRTSSGISIIVKKTVHSTDAHHGDIALGKNVLSITNTFDATSMVNHVVVVGDSYTKKKVIELDSGGTAIWKEAPHRVGLPDFVKTQPQIDAMNEILSEYGFGVTSTYTSIYDTVNRNAYGVQSTQLDISGMVDVVNGGAVSTSVKDTKRVFRYACEYLKSNSEPSQSIECRAVGMRYINGTSVPNSDIGLFRRFGVNVPQAGITNGMFEVVRHVIYEEDRSMDTVTLGNRPQRQTQLNTGHGNAYSFGIESSAGMKTAFTAVGAMSNITRNFMTSAIVFDSAKKSITIDLDR